MPRLALPPKSLVVWVPLFGDAEAIAGEHVGFYRTCGGDREAIFCFCGLFHSGCRRLRCRCLLHRRAGALPLQSPPTARSSTAFVVAAYSAATVASIQVLCGCSPSRRLLRHRCGRLLLSLVLPPQSPRPLSCPLTAAAASDSTGGAACSSVAWWSPAAERRSLALSIFSLQFF
jgi:hypothetical protein